MKTMTPLVAVCFLAMCLVEETCCKAIAKAPLKSTKTSSPVVDVIQSKPKLQSTTKMDPSGHEMDVDDTNDLLIHDRKELQETNASCGKGGVACRRRRKRQFSKLSDATRRSTPGTNRVYDLPTEDIINGDKGASADSVLDDDDDDDDDGHMLILSQRKRRAFDAASDDSDEANMLKDIGDDKLAYSEILGSYMHGEDDMGFRSRRESDSSFTDDLEIDSDDDGDDNDSDLSISSDDTSLSLLKNRLTRETDASSLDTFEEENDEIFDDVVDDNDTDDESVKSDVNQKTVTKRQLRGVPNNKSTNPDKAEETKHNPNNLELLKREKSVMNNDTIYNSTRPMITQSVPETQDENADDDTNSSNAKNSGPETESDAELSDIPLDGQSGDILDRVSRDTKDVTAYEEGADPNSGYMEWETWDPCSVTCGVGRSTRRRVCINPAHCKAGDVEIEACVLNGKYEC